MLPNKSFKIYPRIDKDFQKKNSLEFEINKSNIFKNKPKDVKVTLYFWLNLAIAGIIIGITTFLLDIFCDGLVAFKSKFSTDAFADDSPTVGWIVDVAFTIVYALIACLLTLFVGPGAMGSGVAECMGQLNGVSYPDYTGFKTFGVKFFGVAFAATAGICAGKEGPLVHMGYIIA